MLPPTDELLTAADAADLLGVVSLTVRRWADDGRLPIAHKLPGRTGAYLFRRSDVLALAEGQPDTQEAS